MAAVDDVKEQIDKGFKGIADQQDEQKKAIDSEFELLKKRLAGVEGISSELKQTKEWITEVEAKVNTARTHGPASRDALVDAIPAENRKWIEIAERAGYKDPIAMTAMGSWWQCQFKARGLPSATGKSAQEYLKDADSIEKGWGYDPAQKAEIQKAALGEATAGIGGAIIATPVEAELLRLISDNTILRPLVTKIVMTSLTHQLPIENSNVIAYIHTEAAAITDSMPATSFAQRALTAKGFVGLATVANQLIQDNIIGLNQYVMTAIAERIGILEDIHALEGGYPTTTNFSGVFLAAGVNSFALGTTTVTGGNYPTYQELIQLIYTGQQSATRQGAGFFMLPQVFRGIVGGVDTTGQPIFSFANVPNSIPQFIGGYPVYLVSSLSTQWTGGSNGSSCSQIYYGPPSKIIFGDLTGMSFDIDPYGLFNTVQTRLRVFKRTGIQVPVGAYFTFAKGAKMI